MDILNRIIGSTQLKTLPLNQFDIPLWMDEFWTPKQRQMCSLHEVSYRACFKAELPEFFISRFTQEGDRVYDPFSGRGTTAVQAALMGRSFIANDINPLSAILAEPRTNPPVCLGVEKRMAEIDLQIRLPNDESVDLDPFFHPQTLIEIRALKFYLQQKRAEGREDILDRWIRMVATNRLTGHSSGFFSYYTLPPNQAVSSKRQRKINEKYACKGFPYRDVKSLILRKTKALLKEVPTPWPGRGGVFLHDDAANTYAIPKESVDLIITSPPFLDQIQYLQDNWLRCWFNSLDGALIESRISQLSSPNAWSEKMASVFAELHRVLKPHGLGAFEVGEVRRGKINLEELVIPQLQKAGLRPIILMINQQEFTKTANIWGISNNLAGTNSNRIVLFTKD